MIFLIADQAKSTSLVEDTDRLKVARGRVGVMRKEARGPLLMRADDVVDLQNRQQAVAPVDERLFQYHQRIAQATLVHHSNDFLNPSLLRFR